MATLSLPENDLYRDLFERSADAILIIDDDQFIDCNQATVEMLRYSDKDELLQTHPSELSPKFQPDGQLSYDKANRMMAIAFEKGSHRFEWDHLRADGDVFPVEVLLTAVPKDDRFILHVVWRDITDRKRLEQDLRHAQKMEAVGRLAGGIAHDFNNLLVSIMGHSELLMFELDPETPLYEFSEQIAGAARRASDLTSQLLTFSRKQVLSPEVLNLHTTITNLSKIIERVIGEHITLNVEHSGDAVTVKSDPGEIEQMILNAVSNARDSMPHGGTITLKTSRVELDLHHDDFHAAPGDYVWLRIADTGMGMSPEILSRAFDPFFTAKSNGTGLGLASIYGLAKQSGGDARLSSVPGEGTTLDVLLPFSGEKPEESEPPPQPGSLTQRQETVFVVEDEPAVASIVRLTLEKSGYRVIEASNGAAALSSLADSDRCQQIDLLLTDVVMPVMSGPELVNCMRQQSIDIPVLFMTGYADDMLAKHGFAGVDVDLLRKPFTPTQLLDRVVQCLSRQQC